MSINSLGGSFGRGELLAILGEGSEVAFDLEAVPEGVGLTGEGTEADRHGGGDGWIHSVESLDTTWSVEEEPRNTPNTRKLGKGWF
jgi:hypothetical protein